MKRVNARTWQTQADQIETDKVQLWSSSGVMLTAQMDKETAKKMVADSRCFVISGQAIGFYEDAKS